MLDFLLANRRQVRANRKECACTVRCSKSARYLLPDFVHAQRLLCQIVRERYIFVRHETPNITVVSAQPLKQIKRNTLPQLAPLASRLFLMFRHRVDLLATPEQAIQILEAQQHIIDQRAAHKKMGSGRRDATAMIFTCSLKGSWVSYLNTVPLRAARSKTLKPPYSTRIAPSACNAVNASFTRWRDRPTR